MVMEGKRRYLFGAAALVAVLLGVGTAMAANLLANPGLNSFYFIRYYHEWEERVADDWGYFETVYEDGKLHFMDSETYGNFVGGLNYRREGTHSQVIWSAYEFDAGIYQQVGVTVGEDYAVEASIVSFWEGPGGTFDHTKMVKYVGIDPTGGIDHTSANVIWSEGNSRDNEWVWPDIAARAEHTTITVFVRVTAPENSNHVYLDQVHIDDMHMDEAPSTTLNPAVVAGSTVNLDWDGGPANSEWVLQGYEVQYKDAASGTWQTLQDKYNTTKSGSFAGQPGHSYDVRVRTWQKHNSAANYDLPDVWETTTVDMPGAVIGNVLNNMGFPLVGITVQTTDTLHSTLSGSNGSYVLDTGGPGDYYVTASGTGYNDAPPISATITADSNYPITFTLRPTDDVVQNGDFESGLTGWNYTGSQPGSITSGHRSGNASLVLTSSVTLTQANAVGGMVNPVLSFWYRFVGGEGTFTAYLVRSDTQEVVASFTDSSAGDWEFVSLKFPAGTYTGTLEVRFELVQGGAEPSVYLDEVGLAGGMLETFMPLLLTGSSPN